jgi:hypothetical protein
MSYRTDRSGIADRVIDVLSLFIALVSLDLEVGSGCS